jgi:hypothetical protein
MPQTTPLKRNRLTTATPVGKRFKRETVASADTPRTPSRKGQRITQPPEEDHDSREETSGENEVTTPTAPLAPLRAEVNKHMTKSSISTVEARFAALLKTISPHSISQLPTMELAYKITSFYEANQKRDTTIINSIVERQLSDLPCFSAAHSHKTDYFSEVRLHSPFASSSSLSYGFFFTFFSLFLPHFTRTCIPPSHYFSNFFLFSIVY